MHLTRAAALAALIASTAVAQPAVPPTAAQVRLIPDVGVETEVEIGQPMVVRESLVSTTSLELLETVRSERVALVRIVLQPGVYKLDRSDEKGRYYAEPGASSHGIDAKFPIQGIFVPSDGTEPMAYIQALLGTSRGKTPPMKLAPVDQSGFRRELIYAGVSQKVIGVTYREFVNDLARPAFSQELKYDLSDGSEIGFRGARIRVLNATNVSIRFKVLKPLAPSANEDAALSRVNAERAY